MIVVMADATQFTELGYDILFDKHDLLESYTKKEKGLEKMIEKDKTSFEIVDDKISEPVSLFLDSGAFSAFTKNISIDIDEYIEFIKEHEEYLTVYAVLDIIGNAEDTLKNQQYMESKELNPMPCFHCREDYKYLEYYANNYDYIALGGVAQLSGNKSQLKSWLDEIWHKYLTNSDGSARIKVHGFGITSVEIMKRYPWYSVDSTSWVLTGKFGSVFCDIGDYNKIVVSDQSSDLSGASHFNHFNEMEKDVIRDYFSKIGKGYTIEELATDYKKRDEVNILYFLELEKQLSKKSTYFIQQQTSLF